ncbi:Hypothetical_protein [Hexamita inflata]|uniref:Hypothetical_protein n=1 Tax=Hexamita inflata TaxID=28002 RepID=A0AA86RAI5_9EUKA|nr:Hypothetical protein HINF_LOCUS56903 [Hexamita inflata]
MDFHNCQTIADLFPQLFENPKPKFQISIQNLKTQNEELKTKIRQTKLQITAVKKVLILQDFKLNVNKMKQIQEQIKSNILITQQKIDNLRLQNITKKIIKDEQTYQQEKSNSFNEYERQLVLQSLRIENSKIVLDSNWIQHLLLTKKPKQIEQFAQQIILQITTTIQCINFNGDTIQYIMSIHSQLELMSLPKKLVEEIIRMCANQL